MKLSQAYEEALMVADKRNDKEAAFVANVIASHHSKAVRKLQGLAWLLQNGYSVRTGQFAIDVLLINGTQQGWEVLECPNILKAWGIN